MSDQPTINLFLALLINSSQCLVEFLSTKLKHFHNLSS